MYMVPRIIGMGCHSQGFQRNNQSSVAALNLLLHILFFNLTIVRSLRGYRRVYVNVITVQAALHLYGRDAC